MVRSRVSRVLLIAALAAMVFPLQHASGGGPLQIKCLANGTFYGQASYNTVVGQVWSWSFSGGGNCIEKAQQQRTIAFSGRSLCSSFPGPVTGDPRSPYPRNLMSIAVANPATGEIREFHHVWYFGTVGLLPDDLPTGTPTVGGQRWSGIRMHHWEPVPSRTVVIGPQVGAGAIVLGKATYDEFTSQIPATFVFTFGEKALGADPPDPICF